MLKGRLRNPFGRRGPEEIFFGGGTLEILLGVMLLRGKLK